MLFFLSLFALLFSGPSVNADPINGDFTHFVYDTVSGNVVAVWMAIDDSSGNGLILSAVSASPYTSWTSLGTISDPLTSANNPLVEINDSGNVVAAWLADDFNLELTTMHVATLPLAGSMSNVWSSPIRISLVDEDVVGEHALKINSAGDMWVTWTTLLDAATYTTIQSNHGDFDGSGGSWDGAIAIPSA